MVIKNFLFHRVSDEKDRLWPPMPVSLFDQLIRYISKNYNVVSLEEYYLSGPIRQNGKQIATILFDDGYKDNIEYAVPVLDKYKCPASFYIVTDCIEKNIPTWTYVVDHLFQNTKRQSLEIPLAIVPEQFRKSGLLTVNDRMAVGSRLKPWMKSLSNNDRHKVMLHLQSAFNDVETPQNKMMNWNDLREMKAAGYKIGSHSVSHPLLASIEAEDELMAELKDSALHIERELGFFPETISYPIGSYDSRVIAGAKKVGYKLGLAVHQRFYDPAKDNLFAIPRVELYDEPVWKCKLRISGIYSWTKAILGK